jgi:ATPase subunit of ABC transporter with duplicated ATPase domains
VGNRKSLPQHANPTPALRLIPAHFTEKHLRDLRVIEWIKDSRDIGAQDKAFIAASLGERLLQAAAHAIEEGGPNVTDRQKDQIIVKFLKKYNGLTVSELHKVFLEEFKIQQRIEAEQQEKARAEAAAAREKMIQREKAEQAAAEQKAMADKEAARVDQEQKQKKQQTIFKDWLSGTPASLLELPDGTKIESGFDLNRLTVHGFQLYIAPGTNPLESRHKVRTYTEVVPAGTLNRGLESLLVGTEVQRLGEQNDPTA